MSWFAKKLYNRLLLGMDFVDFASEFTVKFPPVEAIEAHTIYISGNKRFHKWATMECPCGCKKILTMSLMKNHPPYWTVRHDRYKRVSLSPSVWKQDGCRSHFFIKKGKLIWASGFDF